MTFELKDRFALDMIINSLYRTEYYYRDALNHLNNNIDSKQFIRSQLEKCISLREDLQKQNICLKK